jgi:hypothetical protein
MMIFVKIFRELKKTFEEAVKVLKVLSKFLLPYRIFIAIPLEQRRVFTRVYLNHVFINSYHSL